MYEQVRSVADDSVQDEKRTLMFRTGVKKVIRALAEMLPQPAVEVWRLRRRLLDALEEELWFTCVSPGGSSSAAERGKHVMLADMLLSLSPAEMRDFSSIEMFEDWFASEGGEPARRLSDRVAKTGKQDY